MRESKYKTFDIELVIQTLTLFRMSVGVCGGGGGGEAENTRAMFKLL